MEFLEASHEQADASVRVHLCVVTCVYVYSHAHAT